MPPFLAGRSAEYAEFDRLIDQEAVMQNLVLTGLRGLGKTVLLDTLKDRALTRGWLWAGTDLSESASVTETSMATRLIADLAVVTSTFARIDSGAGAVGFVVPGDEPRSTLDFAHLTETFDDTPGLTADRLRAVLELAHRTITHSGHSGRLIFAYDEAQNLSDSSNLGQYPMSVILDVFQGLQRRGVMFMLVLTGLPTLMPKLVEARAYAERMFRVVTLDRLSDTECKEAILRPLDGYPVGLDAKSVEVIQRESGGYPYFVQFMCKEVFDVFIRQSGEDRLAPVPMDAIQRKLDADFFAGRWASLTDRQRQLLYVAANLGTPEEFSIQDLANLSKKLLAKGFSGSHTNQLLSGLTEAGLAYKNRFGRYSFAVPLLDKFILRNFTP